ncbi:MAG TPA: phosphomannomutase/phosphoglucomutase, partial [Alphaproteobacteria bacterium]|nr:phosphomannomutase/phosphoglucomutase [Alphaproteobacteria bacterium]
MEILTDIKPNTRAYEEHALIKRTGFREYDARWLLGSEINLNGFTLLGEALGTQLVEMEITPAIIVGHDYRSYSQSVKNALIIGLMNAGIHVHDIGLCTSPMAYFAQFHLDIPAVAMVTASHNENGWT